MEVCYTYSRGDRGPERRIGTDPDAMASPTFFNASVAPQLSLVEAYLGDDSGDRTVDIEIVGYAVDAR